MTWRANSSLRRWLVGLIVLITGLTLVALFWQRTGSELPANRPASSTQAASPVAVVMPTFPLPSLPPPTVTPSATQAALLFDGGAAMSHVEAQMAFGPRPTGSDASRQTAEYILTTLADLGWEVESWPFEYQGVEGQNLVARAGEAGGPILVFGAHYDTRLYADRDPVAPQDPVPGANDGASGVAVLLELARVLNHGTVEGQVWLAFFDAEDNGDLDGWEYAAGSRIFVEQMGITPEYLVLVDMVGDADQDIYYEGNSDLHLRAHLWAIAAELGYEAYFIPEVRYYLQDDHIPFAEQGIPAVDIIDFDYPYWHTTEDTIDKVSPDSLERVGRVLQTFLERGGSYPEPGR